MSFSFYFGNKSIHMQCKWLTLTWQLFIFRENFTLSRSLLAYFAHTTPTLTIASFASVFLSLFLWKNRCPETNPCLFRFSITLGIVMRIFFVAVERFHSMRNEKVDKRKRKREKNEENIKKSFFFSLLLFVCKKRAFHSCDLVMIRIRSFKSKTEIDWKCFSFSK